MKFRFITFFLITLLILLIGCSKKSIKNDGRLKLSIDYCKYTKNSSFLSCEATLFKDTLKFKEISFMHKTETEISDLPYGNYKVRYKSIFNRYEYIDFKITDNNQKSISLCVDKIDYNRNQNVLLIDEMKIGETLIFSFESQGCFHSSKDDIRITKNQNDLTVTYNETSKKLSALQYNLLREFEIELRSNHLGACSTNNRYGVFNKQTNEIYLVIDQSCQWNGFKNLIHLLDFKVKNNYY
ncbi:MULTISPECIES: hypothetical protein [unclassified Tenacibaculum]|uniref:hypothetical protein n=1 Tax=unclassified Tenacibaculum TaxID=2635139 RepID=UPI001F31CC19|nr:MULTISPECIES: hypothetical protein [unclassified Tenacibaculum]MCF2875013.1 hypothetical protein [Tenacibaculum sp. Cn5-1]MCF2935089.1 hypothetical protein [Tenacibaculum sp. Cn5-34]MCG7511469.1 hypothetical protein [Tenacibaculum sp. Cn5-46]